MPAHLRQVGRNFVTHRLIGRLNAAAAPREAVVFENLDTRPADRGLCSQSLSQHGNISGMQPDPSRVVNRAGRDRLLHQSVDVELLGFDRFMDDPRRDSDTDFHSQILQLAQVLDADLGRLFELKRAILQGDCQRLEGGELREAGIGGRCVGGREIGNGFARCPQRDPQRSLRDRDRDSVRGRGDVHGRGSGDEQMGTMEGPLAGN